MPMEELISAPVLLGAFLLLWAGLVRRSPFDAVVLALAGLLSIFLSARHHLGMAGLNNGLEMLPELILALLALVLLVRAVISPLGCLHRIGFILAALLILLPFLLLAGIIWLFAQHSH